VFAVLGVQRIGRYEVLNHLASGGMGQVYLARATGLGGFERQVVVKTLDLSITDDDEAFVTMFLDEARLVGALHHQYIAPVYEVGCDDQGHYYIVMDYVLGETAEAVFRASGDRALPVPLAFSLTVVSCIASALDYAHSLCSADGTSLDIVHRDVSLSNVMVGYDGGVKLIDFGIAKAANRATKTQVGTLKGKIGYLAPEQILRKQVDHRADIFALGIVLYELTTSIRAFRDNSDLITLERITNGVITPPSQVVADYPKDLDAIVMRALEVDPARRFQDAGTMGRALEALASRLGIALGHAPIIEVMSKLFGERRGRRRFARSSNEVNTDPALAAAAVEDDEKTPVHEITPEDTDRRTLPLELSAARAQPMATPIPMGAQFLDASAARAQRPTTPIVPRVMTVPVALEDRPTPIAKGAMLERAMHATIPLEDRPTPIVDPAPHARVIDATIPLEDRPTPIVEVEEIDPSTVNEFLVIDVSTPPPTRPTPPERPDSITDRNTAPLVAPVPTGPQPQVRAPTGPVPHARVPTGPVPTARVPTEPQPLRTPTGPLAAGEDPDGPTELALLEVDDRDDPTIEMSRLQPMPPYTSPPTPMARDARPKWGPAYVATAVVSRMKPDKATQQWLFMCALFVIAVVAAIVVALV
jgi:serine/threonine-protein kinase